MSDLVTMAHPTLPDQPIQIKRAQIGPRLAAGWEEVLPELQPAELDKPKRQRRTNIEEQ